MRSRLIMIVAGVLIVAALVGGGVAFATSNDDDASATGPEADRAAAAALAHVGGGGRVTGVERESDDGAAWEVEVTLADRFVDVKLDAQYRVLSTDEDEAGGDDEAGDQESDPGEPPDDTAEDEPGDEETEADEPADDSEDEDEEEDEAGAGARTLQAAGPFSPTRFSTTIDNPLVAFASVRRSVMQGREGEARVRSVSRLLDRTTRIAGVRVAIVEVKEYEDDELVERTLDYFAQRDDGGVWYFGEHVDDYEGGKVVGHGGQWIAGKSGAKPGLFMPPRPKVGQTFEQEQAPGVAEDRSTVVATGLTVRTPAGRFTGCIKTRDVAPLDKKTEFKFYCRGVGLVRQQAPGTLVQLVSYS
jgi:hypothetical protein